jgi:hypothetical protein
MNFLDRIQIGWNAARSAGQGMSLSQIEDAMDMAIERKALPKGHKSKLDIRDTNANLAYFSMYNYLRTWVGLNKESVPQYGDPARDVYLSRVWRLEPIMAGAVYSMEAKMMALRWSVTGTKEEATSAARLYSGAAHMGGYDWGGFIASTAEEFYTVNRGVFWETPRHGSPLTGNLADIGHIDSLACTLTGNTKYPMIYVSESTGQIVRFRPGEFVHFASMPSPREENLGIGLCAVDRALRAVNLLIGLHDYDEEKLSNLPPEGVAAVTGLTMEEFNDALNLWRAQRERDNSLTFPQVLWLIGSQPNAKVSLDFVGFSEIPESFDRQSVMTHYISTLALDFGVDAREFWPISSGALGTSAESEIQHLKAKGKGPGEFISTVERHLNAELDEGVQFAFDTQDIEEDQNAAVVAKAWIDAYYPLYTGMPAGKTKASPGGKPNTEMVPSREEQPEEQGAQGAAQPGVSPFGVAPGQPQPEQVIDKDQFLRLLADRGVIPEWMLNDQRVRVDDTSIHLNKEGHPADIIRIEYDRGVLKQTRLPPIVLRSSDNLKDVPAAVPVDSFYSNDVEFKENGHASLDAIYAWMIEKEAEILERNIHGKPLQEADLRKASKVTIDVIKAEMERWRKHPELAAYVPTIEEEAELLNETQSQS